MNKKILCVDFDGVLFHYPSGELIEGALEFLEKAVEVFNVQIFSSRSWSPEGRMGMLNKLVESYIPTGLNRIQATKFVMVNIKFPEHKPPFYVALDDRAITFTGKFPSMEELDKFEAWDKKEKEKTLMKDIPINGPGSLTCDRAGPVTIEDCKSCFGTGSCMYGKEQKGKT